MWTASRSRNRSTCPTRSRWSRASRRTPSGSTSCWPPTPRAGRWSGCRWSIATWRASRSTSCSTTTRSTRRSRSARRSSWPRRCRPTSRRASSTAYWGGSRTTPPRPRPEYGHGLCWCLRVPTEPTSDSVLGLEQTAWVRHQHPVLVEPLDQPGRRRVVDDRQGTQVIGPDRQDPAVVVAPLLLDCPGVPGDVGEIFGGRVVQALEIEHDLVRGLVPDTTALGQQFRHGNPVKLRELGKAGDGDRPIPPLVGADHDGLPAPRRLLLDPLHGQALLLADGAQASTKRLGVLRRHTDTPSHWPEGFPQRSLRSVTVTGLGHAVKSLRPFRCPGQTCC